MGIKVRRKARSFAFIGILLLFSLGYFAYKYTETEQNENIPQSMQTVSPEFSGIRDIYFAWEPETEVDFLEGISAEDGEGGDITALITVDTSALRLNIEGVYPVYYYVKNSSGNEASQQANVTVASAWQIQQWIAVREINRRDDRIIGAINEYDSGVSRYPSMEQNLQYLRPTLVHLRHEEEGTCVAGSGFIIDISEDSIYICTNRHVIEGYAKWEIFLYEGTMVQGTVKGVSREFDVGVLEVPRSVIPKELDGELMTVHIDLDNWNHLEETETEAGLLRLDNKGDIVHILCGNMIKKKTEFLWGNGEMQTEIKIGQTAGDSGSAIFDQYGNLISMVYGTSGDASGNRDWGIPLDAIVSCYEEIMGKKK